MEARARRALRLVPLALLALLAGCNGGGSRSTPTSAEDIGAVVIEPQTLVPARDACHVVGAVVNNSPTSTFDLVLRWQAFDAADRSAGTTQLTLTRILPGERREYESSGFASNERGLVPCSVIARFELLQALVNRR